MGAEAFAVMLTLITVMCGVVLGTLSYLAVAADARHRRERALEVAEGQQLRL